MDNLPSVIAKFMQNDLLGILKRKGYTFETCPIPPQDLRYMLELMQEGHLERKDVKLWCMEQCDAYTRAADLVMWFVREQMTLAKVMQ